MSAFDLDLVCPPSPIQAIQTEGGLPNGYQLFIKRDDLLHLKGFPLFSGNKWRKLKYNLIEASKQNTDRLITFGGAFSNHIAAVAEAGNLLGFQTHGIIRGEPTFPLNPTLGKAVMNGMDLHYINRSAYREKTSSAWFKSWITNFSDYYLIPEGGTNQLALSGVAELMDEVHAEKDIQPDYICVACGTGGTLAGVIKGLAPRENALGFSVLKGDFMEKAVQDLLHSTNISFPNNWSIIGDYHFGGYAKFTTELIDFMNRFKSTHAVPLDPVYTGKLFFGVMDLIQKQYFKPNSSILILHTGGLQGVAGFNQRFGDLLS